MSRVFAGLTCTRRAFSAAVPALAVPELAAYAGIDHPPAPFRDIGAEIDRAVAMERVTGLAIAVLRRGQIIWERGYGWANVAQRMNVQPHTPFSLASITKPFTATLVSLLAAERGISLDAPLSSVLPAFDGDGFDTESATIRQLGAHASGLASLFEMYPWDASISSPSAEQILRDYGQRVYVPGQAYEYSNIGFAALGSLVSNWTHRDFADVLSRRLLAPLNLRDSFFGTKLRPLDGAAIRYDELNRAIPYYVTATPPSGEIFASIRDMAKFGLFNLAPRGQPNLPANQTGWINDLYKPVLRGPGAGATTFGWFTGQTASGIPVIFKDGGQPGVSTVMVLAPSENMGCVILTNRTDNGDFIQKLANDVMAALLPEWTAPDLSLGPSISDFNGNGEFLGNWVGTLSARAGNIKVKLTIPVNGQGMLAIGDSNPEPLSRLYFEGAALAGKSTGRIPARDVLQNQAQSLKFKLFKTGNMLAGRILAIHDSPGRLATIPFQLQLVLT